jgi:hypothetical protein
MNKNSRDQFSDRFKSFQIPEKEINRMYEREVDFQMHLQWMSEQALANQQSGVTSSPAGGAEAPVQGQSSGCLLLTVNTSAETTFDMDVNLSGDVNYIFTWGDGTSTEGTLSSGNSVNIDHLYPDPNEEYFAELCFDDPSVVTSITIYSNRISAFSNLQQFTNLVNFDADNNFLESADFSGMASLVEIDISDCEFIGGGNSLTTVNLSGCTSLEELRLDDSDFSAGTPNLSGLSSLKFFDLDQCGITGSIDISFLPVLDDFDLSGNGELTEVIISSSQPLGSAGQYVNISDCALTQSSVDAILVALSENGISGGTINLQGGTSSAPGSVGLSAKSLLQSNGWTVIVN